MGANTIKCADHVSYLAFGQRNHSYFITKHNLRRSVCESFNQTEECLTDLSPNLKIGSKLLTSMDALEHPPVVTFCVQAGTFRMETNRFLNATGEHMFTIGIRGPKIEELIF